jgi:hypothetical protein
MNEQAAAVETPSKKKQTVYTPVTMGDGRVVQFPGETKAVTSLLKADGLDSEGAEVDSVRWDFRNGETRKVSLSDIETWGLTKRFTIHGATQKLRDCYASEDAVDDCVENFDELSLQLRKGVWSERAAGGGPGGSVLRRALVEATGKTADEVRELLSGLTPKEKLILRNTDELRPIIQRIEAAKVSVQDTSSVLSKVGLQRVA